MKHQKRSKRSFPNSKSTQYLLGLLFPLVILGCTDATKPQKVVNRSMPDKYVNGSFMVELGDGETDANAKDVQAKGESLAQENGCELSAPEKIKLHYRRHSW